MKDTSELVPFCMRCFGIGAICEGETNFCHQCGSEGTCVNMTRKDVKYLQYNIEGQLRLAHKYQYTQEQCKKDTIEHINQVRQFMMEAAGELLQRAAEHDNSKLQEPELQIFTEYTPKLKNSTYGSEEYKGFLKEMKVALDHHYANNSHHPEHYKKYICNGCFKEYTKQQPECCECGYNQFQQESDISQMDLFDLLEMICDWKAAVMRHDDGDIRRSLEVNKERFKIGEQLQSILQNTVSRF